METVVKKRIAVSTKRQITIPTEFYYQLGISNEVDCYVRNGSLIIRPAVQEGNGEFAEEILAELIAKGYSGDELMTEFRKMNRAVRPAVEKMIAEADEIAKGNAEYATMEDIFGK